MDEFLHDGSEIEILVLFSALCDSKMLDEAIVKRVAETDEIKELIDKLEEKFKYNNRVTQ